MFLESILAKEMPQREKESFIENFFGKEQPHFVGLFHRTLLSRLKQIDIDNIQVELQCFNFTVEQLSRINQWARREINFVELPALVEEGLGDSET